MTIPAVTFLEVFQPGTGTGTVPEMIHERIMTSQAVSLHYILAGFMGKDHLRLAPEGEDGGMAQPIFRFKVIFINDIVMRHMTVITMRPFPVTAVAPCGILRRHDVTVHAGLRLVRKIGRRS